MHDDKTRGTLLVLIGSALVVWQWFEIRSGHRATFIGWGFLLPIAVVGAWLVFSGLRLALLPRGVTRENVSVVSASATVLFVILCLGIIAAPAAAATRLGLASGATIGIALATLLASEGSSKTNSFLGSLLLVTLPLGLIGASAGSVYNMMDAGSKTSKSVPATVLLCAVTLVVSLPALMIVGLVMRGPARNSSTEKGAD